MAADGSTGNGTGTADDWVERADQTADNHTQEFEAWDQAAEDAGWSFVAGQPGKGMGPTLDLPVGPWQGEVSGRVPGTGTPP